MQQTEVLEEAPRSTAQGREEDEQSESKGVGAATSTRRSVHLLFGLRWACLQWQDDGPNAVNVYMPPS